jgi:hypothetical protein
MRFLKPDRPAEQKTADSVKPVRQPEPKGQTQWTVMKGGKETTAVMTLFEKASAAQETSPPSHLSITKPKQTNLTGSWLEQRAQDQGAAQKVRRVDGALVQTTVNPLDSHPVHKNVHDEYEIEVDFNEDSPEELEKSPLKGKEQPALSGGQLPME